ncbi:MAG: GGDEF domain-containing protein [Firmicutes bacterium]|nr:GGDEF domain-containing protein [Bacillota bacterium]
MENIAKHPAPAYAEALFSVFEEVMEIDLSQKKASILFSRLSPEEQGKCYPSDELWLQRLALVHPADQPLLESLAAWLHKENAGSENLHLEFRLYKQKTQEYGWVSFHVLWLSPSKYLLCHLDIQPSEKHPPQNGQLRRNIRDLLNVGVVIFSTASPTAPLYIGERVRELLGCSAADFPGLELCRSLQQQIENSWGEENAFELVYFFPHKSGQVLALRLTGVFFQSAQGQRLCSVIIADATGALEKEQQTQWEAERYRILCESFEFITFDYQPEQDLMCIHINFPGFDPRELREEAYLEQQRYKKRIAPEDWEPFLRALQAGCSGESPAQADLQIGPPDKRRWYRAVFSGQADENGRITRVSGQVKDIQKERDVFLQLQELRYRAEIDQGTGLLNKTSAEAKVEGYLQEEHRSGDCALLVLDIDDFKQINDRLGHLQGDILLRQCGQALKASFRKKDIIGRIGGDEFIVFLKEIPGPQLAREKALQLLKAISCIQLEGQPPIHCSLGLCMVSPQERDYQSIFREADAALYEAKKQGKNCFVLRDARDKAF